MSFSLDDQDEEQTSQVDENQQGGTGLGKGSQANQSQTDISLGGGGSGVMTPGAPNTAQQPPAQKQSSSGSWTNLQSYLDANADQGADVGTQISGDVSGKAQTAQDDINNAAGSFKNNVDASTVSANPDQINSVISNALDLKAGSSLNLDDLSGFQKQYSANYNGPTDFTKDPGYAKAQAEASDAQNTVESTKSEAGRDVLLQNKFKNSSSNGYNLGEQNLDQLLLENNPQNKQTFADLQDQWKGLGDLLSGKTSELNTAAQNAVSTNTATAAAAKAALDQANSGFQSSLQTQLTTAQQNYQNTLATIRHDLSTGQITQQEADALGVRAGEEYYSLRPVDYLTPGTEPTLANTATADEYAQALALAQLAGQTDSAFLPSMNSSQAGSAGSPYSFNTSKFNSDIAGSSAAAKQAYDFAWNQKQVIPSLGDNPISMADLQDYVNNVVAYQTSIGRPNPDQWGGTDGDTARQYLAAIDAFKTQHQYMGGTFNLAGATQSPLKHIR